MTSTQHELILRVFISSPGDVPDERTIVQEEIEKLEKSPWLPRHVAIKAVAWDRPGVGVPLPATVTPQAAINAGMPQPSECDLVIVIFATRLGSPLPPEMKKPTGEPYRSGTEWELWDGLGGHQKHGLPEVLVYRRVELPPLSLVEPGYPEKALQRQRLEELFRSEFENPDGTWRRGYERYRDPRDFRGKMIEQIPKQITLVLEKRARGLRPAGGARGLEVGQCPDCKLVHLDWVGRRRCARCKTGVVAEPCLKCKTINGLWNEVCRWCGNDITQSVQEKIKELARARAKLQSLWERQDYEKVVGYLEKLVQMDHPRLLDAAPWIREDWQRYVHQLQVLRREWRQLEQEAAVKQGFGQYALARECLQRIPQAYRSAEGQRLLADADRCSNTTDQLYREFKKQTSRQEWEEAAATLQQLRFLQPDDPRMEAHREALSRGLRDKLLRDRSNAELRCRYLNERTVACEQLDRAYGERLARIATVAATAGCVLFCVTILAIPLVLGEIKKRAFVERSRRFGPLPLSAYRLSDQELLRRCAR
jgi:hypothetical protein